MMVRKFFLFIPADLIGRKKMMEHGPFPKENSKREKLLWKQRSVNFAKKPVLISLASL
jgi:hypothetical protein